MKTKFKTGAMPPSHIKPGKTAEEASNSYSCEDSRCECGDEKYYAFFKSYIIGEMEEYYVEISKSEYDELKEDEYSLMLGNMSKFAEQLLNQNRDRVSEKDLEYCTKVIEIAVC